LYAYATPVNVVPKSIPIIKSELGVQELEGDMSDTFCSLISDRLSRTGVGKYDDDAELIDRREEGAFVGGTVLSIVCPRAGDRAPISVSRLPRFPECKGNSCTPPRGRCFFELQEKRTPMIVYLEDPSPECTVME